MNNIVTNGLLVCHLVPDLVYLLNYENEKEVVEQGTGYVETHFDALKYANTKILISGMSVKARGYVIIIFLTGMRYNLECQIFRSNRRSKQTTSFAINTFPALNKELTSRQLR